jgi:hypothetical protein
LGTTLKTFQSVSEDIRRDFDAVIKQLADVGIAGAEVVLQLGGLRRLTAAVEAEKELQAAEYFKVLVLATQGSDGTLQARVLARAAAAAEADAGSTGLRACVIKYLEWKHIFDTIDEFESTVGHPSTLEQVCRLLHKSLAPVCKTLARFKAEIAKSEKETPTPPAYHELHHDAASDFLVIFPSQRWEKRK